MNNQNNLFMIKKCIYFAIFMTVLFSFVDCKRKDYYTGFLFEVCIYKDFEKEISSTETFYSSGNYSDNSGAGDAIEIPLPKCNLHVEDEVVLCRFFNFPGSTTVRLYVMENQEQILKFLNENGKESFLFSLGEENNFSDLKISDSNFDDYDNRYLYRYWVCLREPVKKLDVPIVSDFYIKRYQE
jgi:hypothetical protein